MIKLTMSSKNTKNILHIIFTFSLILMIILAFYNRESNDPDYEVSAYIADNNVALSGDNCPEKGMISECLSPKLYYNLNAIFYNIYNIKSTNYRILFSQYMNVLMCGIVLYYILKFLSDLKLKQNVKIISFSLAAFNPALIRISIQATADMFVIGFGIMTLYHSYYFFKDKTKKHFIFMTIFAIFAALSKLNGLVLFFVIILSFLFQIFSEKKYKKKILKHFLIFFIIYLAIVPFFGQFIESYNYTKELNFYEIDEKEDFPKFFKKTYPSSPGIISIWDGYFKFPFFDLIKTPYIINKENTHNVLSKHMTSLCTSLYGRAMFIPYSCGPFNGARIQNIGRAVFILGLVPLAVFIYGFLNKIIKIKDIVKKKKTYEILFLLSILGYFGLIIALSLQYRDFTSMKVIYSYPALLAFVYIFSTGLNKICKKYSKRKLLLNSIQTVLIAIVILHIIDIFNLIVFLS